MIFQKYDMTKKLESELLLTFLSCNLDKVKSIRFEDLTSFDWENIFKQAARHGVTALLYQRLKILNKENELPPVVKMKLRETYVYTLIQNTRLYQELVQVLKVFKENDVPVIVMKGAYLAKFVYKNIAFRPMSDIDLLVKEEDYSTVKERLSDLNYHPLKHYGIEEPSRMEEYLSHFRKKGSFQIDLHFSVERPNKYFSFDNVEIWKNAKTVAMDNVKLSVLSNEDLILHLCIHASFFHKFRFGLRALCDISETVQKFQDEIDWGLLQQRAGEWKIVKYVYLTLFLVKDLLDSPIPDEVLEKMKPPEFDPRKIELAKEQIFQYRNSIAAAPPISLNLALLFGGTSLKDKLFLFIRTIFPPPKFIAQKYSLPLDSMKVYLYYPVRLKDVIFRYGRSAWRLLFRDKNMAYLAKWELDENALEDWLA